MKAYEIQSRPGLESLTRVERPQPEPGPGQVVLKMLAASLNYRDIMVAKGAYGGPTSVSPFVPLSDGVGEVVQIGPGVSRVATGDRVTTSFFPSWIEGAVTQKKVSTALGGGGTDGALAEYIVLSEDGVIPAPAYLSDEEAATLPCAGVTAWNALFGYGAITAADTVLVQGTGGVSLFALQFAKAAGARVILTSSSDAKIARARELGADETINYKTTPDWDQRAMELTNGVGVNHVVEVGGTGTLSKSITASGWGGSISVIGGLSGFAVEVPAQVILARNLRIQGIYVGSRALSETLNKAITQTRLHPVVDRVFSFDQASEAYAYMESGSHFGKIVIRF